VLQEPKMTAKPDSRTASRSPTSAHRRPPRDDVQPHGKLGDPGDRFAAPPRRATARVLWARSIPRSGRGTAHRRVSARAAARRAGRGPEVAAAAPRGRPPPAPPPPRSPPSWSPAPPPPRSASRPGSRSASRHGRATAARAGRGELVEVAAAAIGEPPTRHRCSRSSAPRSPCPIGCPWRGRARGPGHRRARRRRHRRNLVAGSERIEEPSGEVPRSWTGVAMPKPPQ